MYYGFWTVVTCIIVDCHQGFPWPPIVSGSWAQCRGENHSKMSDRKWLHWQRHRAGEVTSPAFSSPRTPRHRQHQVVGDAPAQHREHTTHGQQVSIWSSVTSDVCQVLGSSQHHAVNIAERWPLLWVYFMIAQWCVVNINQGLLNKIALYKLQHNRYKL